VLAAADAAAAAQSLPRIPSSSFHQHGAASSKAKAAAEGQLQLGCLLALKQAAEKGGPNNIWCSFLGKQLE
jgi:hypothetical protein